MDGIAVDAGAEIDAEILDHGFFRRIDNDAAQRLVGNVEIGLQQASATIPAARDC